MGVACLLLGALLSLNFQKLVSDLNNFEISLYLGRRGQFPGYSM